ncbi:MAG: hypothetical protein HC897_20570, partial [Thermoanaerobaculia bacterium]|nr:hypothetical protein [Thermoanaerobaculia bacterium]
AEHHACRWVSPAELEALDWAEADLPILPACQQALERGGSQDTPPLDQQDFAPKSRFTP